MLGIDLQDGFKDDTVIVEVNDNEIFRGEHISTRLPLGVARTLKTEVERGEVSIRLIIPTKKLEHTITLEVLGNTYLGISVVYGVINFRVSDEPFGYL